MKKLTALPLRTMLTVPYVALILALAGVIGTLSYRSGREAVEAWSDQLLVEVVERIKQAVERHVSGSAAVLEAAFPQGVSAPESLADELGALRTRFWLATSMHRDPNNYAYYGDRQGRFFGLYRHSEVEAELRLRMRGEGPRSIYRFSGIQGPLGEPATEGRIFDPRERPWFKSGQSRALPTWTSIYIDFKTAELVATRARRVDNRAGEFEGVVATDLSLVRVNEFLQRLALSANGVAFVVEGDGNLIGVSRGPNIIGGGSQGSRRLHAGDSPEPMVAATYRALAPILAGPAVDTSRTVAILTADGQPVQVGYSRLRDAAGLDWIIVVGVPRSDFLGSIETNFRISLALAVAASVLVAALGLWVLSVVAGELGRLAAAARGIGAGGLETPLDTTRSDEIGQLARSFSEMQSRLLTDQLTGLANRMAIVRRIEDRILQHRRRGDGRPFVVLFIDFNRFKQVNDTYGHDVGDQVLQELARRIRSAVRSQDMVGRFAGDEFVVLLDTVDRRSDAEAVREHIERALRRPLQTLDGSAAAGAEAAGGAIGLAIYPDDGQDVDSLLRHADADMYRRKPAPPPDTP